MASFVFATVMNPLALSLVRASAPGQVVINEIAWAGSADSSTDEWIELYNNSNQAVDLSNWHIVDDNGDQDYKILSGTVAAKSYFLIEDHESTVANISSDAIIDLSLANGGDSLQLQDSANQVIDTVNGSGGAWYAGSATTHGTMERIDPASSADVAANWAISVGGTGAKSSGGTVILGTPKAVNSKMVSGSGNGSGGSGSTQQSGGTGSSTQTSVDFISNVQSLHTGDVITLTAKVNDVQNLFAYGFEISYDPAVLHYEGSSEQGFLSQNGAVPTSFQADLKDGHEGTLLVADARTMNPKVGVNGSGELLEMQFDVLSSEDTNVTAGVNSFLGSTTGDIATQFHSVSLTSQTAQLAAPSGLSAAIGPQRYSIALHWNSVAGAQTYDIYRKDAHGAVVKIGETAQTDFVDADGVAHSGFIIPGQNYVYEITAANGSIESLQSEVVGQDSRGLKGDNNRNDLVDGRDLQALAKHFAETDVDVNFDPLVDTTYDGRIDGGDLIDLAANFALSYQA